jgi:beta-ureidopropionase
LSVRVALGQVEWATTSGAMVDRLEELMWLASSKGARLIAFPELCTTGYFCGVKSGDRRRLAETIPDGPTIHRLREVARATRLVSIIPIAEAATSERCFNSAAIIDADGRLLGMYRKQHLPHFAGSWERFYFRVGQGWPVFATAIGRIGVAICWDRFFPETWRALALAGAEIIINPIASAIQRSESKWISLQSAAAFSNQVFVAVVNWAGPSSADNALPCSGGSFVVDPSGELLGGLASGNEELVIRELNLRKIWQSRLDWPFYQTRRPSAYRQLVIRRAPSSFENVPKPPSSQDRNSRRLP